MQFSTFSFAKQHNVRAFEKDGIAWFVATDICAALEIQNVTQAIEKLDDDERSMFNIGRSEIHGGGGTVNIVNESGMYILALRSRKAMEHGSTAWKFRKWVTSEVLPTIRKTGSYTNPQPDTRINAEQKQTIREAVQHRHHRTGEHWQEIYRKLHNLLRVNSYHEIQARDFQTALSFLASIPNAPAKPKAEPKPECINGHRVKYRMNITFSQFNDQPETYLITLQQGKIIDHQSFRPTNAKLEPA